MIKKVFLCLLLVGIVPVQGFALDWGEAVKRTCYNFGVVMGKQHLQNLQVTNSSVLKPGPEDAQTDTETTYAGQCTVFFGSDEDPAQHALQMELHFSTSQSKVQAVHSSLGTPLLMVIYDGSGYRVSPAPGKNPGDLTHYFAIEDYHFLFDLQDR